jgi:hypothetical protein
MSEEIPLTEVIQAYKEELSHAHERIVILQAKVKARDQEISRLRKDE